MREPPIFYYPVITCQHGDEEYGYEFEFQPTEEELTDKLSEVIYDTHFRRSIHRLNKILGLMDSKFISIEKDVLVCIKDFLEENDLSLKLADRYEDELRQAFKEQAYDEYEDVD